jgi:alpha-D-xyloside xylohydrolase
MNYAGRDLDLYQHNIVAVVPFLASSRGYGLLWDNTSFTRLGDLRPDEPIPAGQLLDASGRAGGLTGSYYAGAAFDRLIATRVDAKVDIETPPGGSAGGPRIHPDLPQGDFSVRWEGAVEVPRTGDYALRTFSNGTVRLFVDGRLVMDHFRQAWLPWDDVVRVRLEAGRKHQLRLEWSVDEGQPVLRFTWKTPSAAASTSLWSEVGDGIDYYFVYGPDLDEVVAGYRRLTGAATLLPRWAFGLWQSRERYQTAQESLDVLEGFRSRAVPIDVIVQDWRYWRDGAWGSHEFDPARFPDPEGWIRAVHDRYKARLMISVWGKFYPGTANFEALRERGFLFESTLHAGMRDWLGQPYAFYDAFSQPARQLFWSQIDRALFRKGVDAWWMDATEPDMIQPMPTLDGVRTHMHPTAMGTGARVLNAYSLVNSQGVYEGQRAAAPDQRVLILTRSGFAGQQRYAAATWSGDITSSWSAFRAQIPAGVSFSLSGLPFWTTDSGGFSVPARFAREQPDAESLEEWRELNTRWFQFATFCPLTRVHGQFPYREMWQFGGEAHPAYSAQLRFDRLRYALLPYVYSLAGAVTQDGGTMMRGLVMDFRGDRRARAVADQFMFGPAFLISPVTAYRARSREVYLPDTPGGWYDFWSGAHLAGGRSMDAPAPYDALPVHVRAGSIVPVGPALQFTSEKPADPITVFVYQGADGRFTLYEDDGVSYGYERGASSRIPMRWDEARRTLEIGSRAGGYPGMLADRTFRVVFVSAGSPVAFDASRSADRSVQYVGERIEVRP